MTFYLSKRSEKNLTGVQPALVSVVRRALELTEVDFAVVEGVRSKSRQVQLYNEGASKTLNSRHLTGHAVDIAPFIDGQIRWDWPPFYKLADAMKKAADELGVSLDWGGDWKTFKDGPHFELDWSVYPSTEVAEAPPPIDIPHSAPTENTPASGGFFNALLKLIRSLFK